jgi:hypothetical protein
MEKTNTMSDNYGSYNNLIPPTVQSSQLDLPSCPENGHLHPDGYEEANAGQATNLSEEYGCTVEPEELDHTCLYHSILDKLDRDENEQLDRLDRLSNLRESLSDPTVLKVLELLEYIEN